MYIVSCRLHKGFSLNVKFKDGFVAICYGYPPTSVYKQSIYTGFEAIVKKVNNSESITTKYKHLLENFKEIEPAKTENKWIIDKDYTDGDIARFTSILKEIVEMIRKEAKLGE